MGDKLVRPSSQYLDDILGFKFPVLDLGFVRCVDYMGNDDSIVQAARVSFAEDSSKNPKGLIDYLVRMRHTSPLEMAVIKFQLKMPIFVARQWIRTRMSSTNEMSGRYVEIPDDFYITNQFYKKATSNKQGRSDEKIDEKTNSLIRESVYRYNRRDFELYFEMLDAGIAPEQAREHLPLNTYTMFVWKIDLHNLLHFLKLRTDPHAQWEIRQYAEQIERIVTRWVPLVHDAWVNYSKESITLSKRAMENVRKLVTKDHHINDAWEDISKREKREVLEALGFSDLED